jgi:hypothetical protein
VEVQASEAPPPLPDYEQPPCPTVGYLWTPGYWAYAPGGYFWVPGTWVGPPAVGLLWTPGYWGFAGGVYGFHVGYWGPHVGFYGGVNYGFGYVGVGFAGGRWVGGSFAYNTAVSHVNVTVVHNTYNETVVNNTTNVSKVSYNGPGGSTAAPTPAERAAASERHVPPTPVQQQHVQQAAKDPSLSAKANGGKPPVAATARPGELHGPGVVSARGAAPPRPASAEEKRTPSAPKPNTAKPPAPNTAKPPAANTSKAPPKPGAKPAAKPAPKPAAKPAPKAPKPPPRGEGEEK